MNFEQIISFFKEQDCYKLFIKELAENDNSKNQVYFGPGFNALNIIPNLSINPSNSGSKSTPIFKAPLNFSWFDDHGKIFQAPYSQIIFYPQYPEVRFSGFLRGCAGAPSDLMGSRLKGRILFLGVKQDGQCFAYVAPGKSALAKETLAFQDYETVGVFRSFAINSSAPDTRKQLLYRLKTISEKGWIDSKRLGADKTILPCNAPNCGGYTLEAELGIIPNAEAAPDFLGWEVKQYKVSNFKNTDSGVITLMTPEPTNGIYVEDGLIPFVRKYGYLDKNGIEDRYNFGGLHKYGMFHRLTNLKLSIQGYDSSTKKITDNLGGIVLLSQHDEIAAKWDFKGLMTHWNKKHAQAVYVPSLINKLPLRQYCYAPTVKLGVGTDFHKLLESICLGSVYYDPGIKVEKMSSDKPKTKRRSQFRIKTKDLSFLYSSFEKVNLS